MAARDLPDMEKLYRIAAHHVGISYNTNQDVDTMATWIQRVLWLMANANSQGMDSKAGQELLALCQEAKDKIL